MEDNSGNKQIPDLGEGIKPEDVVYSSRDILGSSVAGGDKKFFTRVKKEKPLINKDTTKKLKEKHETRYKNIQKLFSNKKFWIIFLAILGTVAVCLAVVIFVIRGVDNNMSDGNGEDGPDSSQYEERIESSDDESEASLLRIEYAESLESDGDAEAAIAQLDQVDPSILSPENQTRLYAAYRSCYGLFSLDNPEKYDEYNNKIREIVTANSDTLGTGFTENDYEGLELTNEEDN